MKALKINEIAKVVGAIDYTSSKRFEEVTSVNFDSREIKFGALFVPLLGNTDGHDYIDSAIKNGATATLWSKPLTDAPDNIAVIQVEDTLTALQQLAKYYLSVVNPKVIAITGSSGKTTTKDMTAAALSTTFRVHKTEGNFNNEIGMPITILSMPENTEIIVLEMGMSNFGEIEQLSMLAEPDIAIITMIGENHIEFLGSREGIAQAKLEILKGLKADGTLIYPGDEPLIREGIPEDHTYSTIAAGLNENNDIFAFDIHMSQYETKFLTNLSPACEMNIPVSGEYNVKNALVALAAAFSLGLSMEQAREPLSTFKLTANRTEWVPGFNHSQILNDAYNASPSAMKAVIKNFASISTTINGRKMLVLGDMLELGDMSAQLHAGIADVISPNVYSHIVLYGREMEALYNRLLMSDVSTETIVIHYRDDKESLINYLKEVIEPQDQILIKSSNATGLLTVVEALRMS